jgi:hypothetical protein
MTDNLAVEAGRLPLERGRMTQIEATAFAVYRLTRGDALTPGFLSALTGLTMSNCWNILDEASRLVPIYEDGGYWRMLA